MARRLNEDHSDHSGSTTACACGQTARYAGRRPKTFTSVLGPLTLERAYYHCDTCRAGICPRDRALGLHATSLSPGVLRMVGLAASDFSFAAASDLLWELVFCPTIGATLFPPPAARAAALGVAFGVESGCCAPVQVLAASRHWVNAFIRQHTSRGARRDQAGRARRRSPGT